MHRQPRVTSVQQMGPGGTIVYVVGSARAGAATDRWPQRAMRVPEECEECEQYNANDPGMGYAPTCELITRDGRPCAVRYASAIRLNNPPTDNRCLLWRSRSRRTHHYG